MPKGLIQHRQRPTPVEDLCGCFIGSRLGPESSFGLVLVEGQKFSTTATLGRLATVILVDQKVSQRRQQKRAESARVRIEVCQPVLFEQPRKKFLREVL